MAGVIGRAQEGKYLDRKSVVDVLKANLEQNAFAFGSWFGEEPNAFDGQSPSMAGKTETGSATPIAALITALARRHRL